jgi:quinol-cytochrome oxidoreductase complex cytochrome b subunit
VFRVFGILIVVLALVIAIVPQFTDCQSQGRMITLENGKTIPMKCHWTSQAALGMGIVLLAVGALLAFSRRKETRLALSVLGMLLGAIVILLPTWLIGVCANPDMLCKSIEQPTLILSGSLVIVISLAGLVFSLRQQEQAV